MNGVTSSSYRPCVGIMLLNEENRILTGQRLDHISTAWQMPQGGIEKEETVLTAAYRELEEETSIEKEMVEVLAVSTNWLSYDLPSDLVPRLWNGSYKGQTQKWFLMRYFGRDTDINLQTKTPEFSSWRWSSPQELVASIVPFKKEVYETIVDEFKAFL